MDKPLVTIILTTYNRAHLITETLNSIVAQSFKNWECIIIDDNSKDNTCELVTEYIKEDRRFEFIVKPKEIKQGLPASRNIGLKNAKGDYIIFFDDDDYIHPQNLETCVKVFSMHDVDFCHYQKKPFLDGEKPEVQTSDLKILEAIGVDKIEDVITQKIGLASCTVMWKSKCFLNEFFNENLMYAEEWECYSRLISNGNNGLVIANVLYYNRKHLASNTGQFFTHNPIQKESKKEAILLLIKMLIRTKLLSESLLLYFVKLSVDFKEYKLFNTILELVKPRGKFYLWLKYFSFVFQKRKRIMKKEIKKLIE